jgi:hypothetical protein
VKKNSEEQKQPVVEKSKKFVEFLELMKSNQKGNQEISWNDNVGK